MKNLLFAFFLFMPLFVSCHDGGKAVTVNEPFNDGTNVRNKIAVVSDFHLGADLSYAECNKNLGTLSCFLREVRGSLNIKELVIAGDMLDEWFVPADVDTYADCGDQKHFVEKIAKTNAIVINELNGIIKDGKIKVTYVPGNHDMEISGENISSILPGMNLVADAEGVGTYHPEGYPEIAIEHGHRYNFFASPDPVSNQGIASGTILPTGYFLTRLIALHAKQGAVEAGGDLPEIAYDNSWNAEQAALFKYGFDISIIMKAMPVSCKPDEKIIVTGVDHFTGRYAMTDLLPYLLGDGTLDVNLYKGITKKDNWEMRQSLNNVSRKLSLEQALSDVLDTNATTRQAEYQYFLNPASNVRIVIFGHTHKPFIKKETNYHNDNVIYANSGAWIDDNLSSPDLNETFLIITPQSKSGSPMTKVALYQYMDSKAAFVDEDSIAL
ncbi:MAG: metallophosphoesterase [Bacteroidales bacterium]|nr:metallophosphoesterase [Bacteroidales bacterium]